MIEWNIESLKSQHDRSQFDCGLAQAGGELVELFAEARELFLELSDFGTQVGDFV